MNTVARIVLLESRSHASENCSKTHVVFFHIHFDRLNPPPHAHAHRSHIFSSRRSFFQGLLTQQMKRADQLELQQISL